MFFHPSSLAVIGGLVASVALALPTDHSHSSVLARRDLQFMEADWPEQSVTTCTEDEQKTIRAVFNDAAKLADAGRKSGLNSPAYRTFMDAKESFLGDDVSNLAQIEKQNHDYVVERFDRAYKLLKDPSTDRITVLCGKTNPKNADAWCKQNYEAVTNPIAAHGQPASIVICPNFFNLPTTLDTKVGNFNLCFEEGKLAQILPAAGTLLHEIMHLRYTAPLGDDSNAIVDCVYGAYLSQIIASKSPKKNRVSLKSADNYLFMALSAWANQDCNRKYKGEIVDFTDTAFHQETPEGHVPADQLMGWTQNFDICKFPLAKDYGLPTKPFDKAKDAEVAKNSDIRYDAPDTIIDIPDSDNDDSHHDDSDDKKNNDDVVIDMGGGNDDKDNKGGVFSKIKNKLFG